MEDVDRFEVYKAWKAVILATVTNAWLVAYWQTQNTFFVNSQGMYNIQMDISRHLAYDKNQ